MAKPNDSKTDEALTHDEATRTLIFLAIVLRGARGEYRQPGEFRISQNWIGC